MVPLRASTTKSESLPDDPTAFVPSRPWNLPSITTWDDSRNQNHPTDSAEEAFIVAAATGIADTAIAAEMQLLQNSVLSLIFSSSSSSCFLETPQPENGLSCRG